MVRLIENGKIEEVVLAKFGLGENVLKALYDIYQKKDIRASIILDGSGGAVDFTHQHSPINSRLCPTNVSIGTVHGKCEISLRGTTDATVYNLAEGDTPDTVVKRIFPTTPGLWEEPVDKWPMVGCEYGPGTSYTHIHCMTSNADYTVCGHLMPGTRAAFDDPSKPSHFTVIIAEINGVELQATADHKIGFYQNLVRVGE